MIILKPYAYHWTRLMKSVIYNEIHISEKERFISANFEFLSYFQKMVFLQLKTFNCTANNQMGSIYKIKESRNRWKGKASTRGKNLRYQLKENKRLKKERDQYKEKAREAQIQLKKELQKKQNQLAIKKTSSILLYSFSLAPVLGFAQCQGC